MRSSHAFAAGDRSRAKMGGACEDAHDSMQSSCSTATGGGWPQDTRARAARASSVCSEVGANGAAAPPRWRNLLRVRCLTRVGHHRAVGVPRTPCRPTLPLPPAAGVRPLPERL